jgi:ATP-dependent DNA ligase
MTSRLPGTEELGGERVDKGTWAFPEVRAHDARGKERFTRVFARLRDVDGETIPVKRAYGDGTYTLPDDVLAEVWNETGQVGGKTTEHKRTVIHEGKNVGKANATNTWTQALAVGLSRWRSVSKRASKGDDALKLPAPMLLEKYPDHKLKYPIRVQTKYDGARAMITLATKEATDVLREIAACKSAGLRARMELLIDKAEGVGAFVYSRTREIIPVWYLAEEALPVLKRTPSLIIDGELVATDDENKLLSLQKIVQAIKREETALAAGVTMMVFDVFDRKRPDLTFDERWGVLMRRKRRLERNQRFQLVDVSTAARESELERMHKAHLAEGHEGTVLRDPNGQYELKRSLSVLKYKPRLSEEFELVGYASGDKGKAKNMVMWVVRVPPQTDGPRKKHVDLRLDPTGMTHKERRDMLQQFEDDPQLFKREYKGRQMTVEFFNWSDDGIPMQAKAVAVQGDR